MKTILFSIAMSASLWSITIDDAVERAIAASPILQRAQSDVNEAKYSEMQTTASFRPILSVGFDWSDVTKTTAFGYTPAYSYNLSAKYNVFNGFKDYHTLKAQEIQSEALKLLYQASVSDLRLNVESAYCAYLQAKTTLQTQQMNVESLEQSMKDTKVRYEQGMIAKNELLLIDVDLLSAKQAVISAKSNLNRLRSNLNRIMGGSLLENDNIEKIQKNVFEIRSFEELQKFMYENRSELVALQKLKDASKERYEATKSSYFPTLDVGADYIVNDRELNVQKIGVTQQKDYVKVTVNATWPLYGGGLDEAYRMKALEQVSRQDNEIKAMKLDLEYQLIDAYEMYKTAKSALMLTKRAKESANENYRITREQHRFGNVDTLTLLKAQSNLTAASNSYNEAYYNLYVSLQTIKRVVGQ